MGATTYSTGGAAASLSVEDIRRAIDAISDFPVAPKFSPFGRSTLFGLDVLETPARLVPKVKMNDTFPHSDKALDDMNAWLLARFGTRDESLVPRGTVYRLGNNILVMRPEDVVRLRSLI